VIRRQPKDASQERTTIGTDLRPAHVVELETLIAAM